MGFFAFVHTSRGITWTASMYLRISGHWSWRPYTRQEFWKAGTCKQSQSFTLIWKSKKICSTLKQTHRVIFNQKSDDNKELGRQNAGFSLPFRASGLLRLVWHCRWTTKGLSPIKPALHLIGQINLPAGHAIKLHVAWELIGQIILQESGFVASLFWQQHILFFVGPFGGSL